MNCDEAKSAILVADPLELEGRGEGPLSLHIRSCDQCQERARIILAAEAGIASELESLVREPDLDRVLQEAHPRSRAPFSRGERVGGRIWGRTLLARPLRTVLPLALVTGLAALFLLQEPSLPGIPYAPPHRDLGLEVEVPSGQNVAVLATNDPNITVLWLF
jgi:hypothetical protein